MKASSESRLALARRAGLILLFDGEVGPEHRTGVPPVPHREPRRAPPNRYPDFGPGTSLPPSRSYARPVAVGVCSPLQWRNRPRFSRGSLTFGGVRDGPSVHPFQRTSYSYSFNLVLPRPNLLVGATGVEPARIAPKDPKSFASANSATRPNHRSIFAPAKTVVNTFQTHPVTTPEAHQYSITSALIKWLPS